ncbi:hypothetical protein F5B19DRAFT_459846 [Rostrohypoxylon terebratum]|nr:hypothetical protein F5B19DRAFT_459846 [Rostrohypoxylon terebratum]
MEQPIPRPRQFLTSLIDGLTSIPSASAGAPSAPTSLNAGASNPLRLIPSAYRPLLTTLYTIYPLTLLPALDLLDRRLATRVIIISSTTTPQQHPRPGTSAETAPSSSSPPPSPPSSSSETPGKAVEATPPTFYIVRSAQPQHPRRGEPTSSSSSSSTGLSYVVRLNAWNCTCAAFAFAAFPRDDRDAQSYAVGDSAGLPPEEWLQGDAKWEFGALSADGMEGSGIAGVPCCKHLLACVLAERWRGLLGGYVDERVVSREEGAGLVADI